MPVQYILVASRRSPSPLPVSNRDFLGSLPLAEQVAASILRLQAEALGDRPFVLSNKAVITYAEAHARANRVSLRTRRVSRAARYAATQRLHILMSSTSTRSRSRSTMSFRSASAAACSSSPRTPAVGQSAIPALPISFSVVVSRSRDCLIAPTTRVSLIGPPMCATIGVRFSPMPSDADRRLHQRQDRKSVV